MGVCGFNFEKSRSYKARPARSYRRNAKVVAVVKVASVRVGSYVVCWVLLPAVMPLAMLSRTKAQAPGFSPVRGRRK